MMSYSLKQEGSVQDADEEDKLPQQWQQDEAKEWPEPKL